MSAVTAIRRFFIPGRAKALTTKVNPEKMTLAEMRRAVGASAPNASAVAYEPVARSIELVVSEAARIISESVYAVDEERRPLRSARARRATEILRTSLDGGICSAYYGLVDLLYDLATTGNALAVPVFGMAGRLSRLDRIKATTASWEDRDQATGRPTGFYRGTLAGSSVSDVFSPREVIHARWGGLRSQEDRFSVSPLRVLARSVQMGTEAEEAILREFTLGPESRSILTAAPSATALEGRGGSDGTIKDVWNREEGKSKTVRRAAEVKMLPKTPTEEQQVKLLALFTGQVSALYGVPLALLNHGGAATGEDFKNLRRLGVLPLVTKFLEAAQVLLLRPGAKFRVNSTVWEFEDAEGRAKLMDRLWPNTGRQSAASFDEFREIAGLLPASDEVRADAERISAVTPMSPAAEEPPPPQDDDQE